MKCEGRQIWNESILYEDNDMKTEKNEQRKSEKVKNEQQQLR